MNSRYWTHLNGRIGGEEEAKLAAVLASRNYYHYGKDVPAKIQSEPILYNSFGDIRGNRLYLTLNFSGKIYYGSIASPVLWPAMVDRLFGIDVMDGQAINWLSDMMIYVFIDGQTEDWVFEKWEKDFNEYKNECA